MSRISCIPDIWIRQNFQELPPLWNVSSVRFLTTPHICSKQNEGQYKIMKDNPREEQNRLCRMKIIAVIVQPRHDMQID